MKTGIFNKITKKNYYLSFLIIIAVSAVLVLINREHFITVFDENSERIELIHCEQNNSLNTGNSFMKQKDSILFSVMINKESDWGLIAKNDYMWQKTLIDLQNYNNLRVRIKSIDQDFELVMIGFRTRMTDNVSADEHLKNIGIMWSKIISIREKGNYFTIDIPLNEFTAYQFDPVNQKYFRNRITSSFSHDAAQNQDQIIFQELIIQPYSHIFGERKFEVDYAGFVKNPLLSRTAIVIIIIILTLILMFISVIYDYLKIIRDEELLTEEIKISRKALYQAYEKLKIQDRAKTDFFANISHELRTPLTLILAPVEDALSGKNLNRETLEMIRRNGLNLLSLINDLLDVSRITAGKMKLAISETDLSEMIKQFCGGMESAARRKGIELSCNTCSEPVKVYADSGRFAHVISNFFSNSFKFTEAGGKIEVSVKSENNLAMLIFSDTGCGIPADKLKTIFNRFTQTDTNSNRIYEGTGIGLSIVKDIVELHGGEVSADSRCAADNPETHGTTFTVKLPFGKEHFTGRSDVDFITAEENKYPVIPYVRGIEAEIPGYEADAEIVESAPSILIVEDNSDLRRLLVNMLHGRYVVHEASGGNEAVTILENTDEIDLVLSDIMMPGMDGYDLLRWIRSDAKFEGMPVIFLSARTDHFMRIEGLDLGATDYVTKPFNAEELLLRITNQMELKMLRNSAKRKYNSLIEKLKSAKPRQLNEENESKIKAVCEFIQAHYTDELQRDDLAEAAGVNPDTFSRLFNQYTGKTLNEYIHELRITEAGLRLSKTEDTVTRIAIDTGFDNIRTFNRVFKKIAGVTPGEFRGRCKAQ